jgi:hypothetical protein
VGSNGLGILLARPLWTQGEPAFSTGVAYAALGELDRAFDLWLNETEWTILLPAHFR